MVAWGCVVAPGTARGEAVLQYFNTDWREITARMPELAEAGYEALWVPPPTKGSGGLSVGYDLWDRFDLGGKDQRGTVRTRYGTEADLQLMLETAHRFGLRVYFDNIMNHNSFDVPGYNAGTPIDVYPGFVPEDFHLRITEDGFYRKWDNTRDWNDAWQVQNLGLADLIDIAIESPNTNHGRNEGDDIPKITFVRHPQNPEYYLDLDLPIGVSNSGGSFTTFTFANKEPWQDVGVAGVAGSAGNGRFDWVDTDGNGQHNKISGVAEPSEPFADTGVDPLPLQEGGCLGPQVWIQEVGDRLECDGLGRHGGLPQHRDPGLGLPGGRRPRDRRGPDRDHRRTCRRDPGGRGV